MAINDPGNLAQSQPYLLKLFNEDIERRLVAEAIAKVEAAYKQAMLDIRPSIEAAAREAVKGMESAIRSHHDMMREDLIVQFVGKVPAPEVSSTP